jgi:hypothetical protein
MSSRKISLIRSGENSTSDEYFFQGGLPGNGYGNAVVESFLVAKTETNQVEDLYDAGRCL